MSDEIDTINAESVAKRKREMSSANYQSEIIIQLRKEIDRVGHVLRASQSAAFENQAEVFRLRAEIERLRAALAEAADNLDYWGGYVNANKARAALEVKHD